MELFLKPHDNLVHRKGGQQQAAIWFRPDRDICCSRGAGELPGVLFCTIEREVGLQSIFGYGDLILRLLANLPGDTVRGGYLRRICHRLPVNIQHHRVNGGNDSGFAAGQRRSNEYLVVLYDNTSVLILISLTERLSLHRGQSRKIGVTDWRCGMKYMPEFFLDDMLWHYSNLASSYNQWYLYRKEHHGL